MAIQHQGCIIKSSVYNRPKGVPYFPRASVYPVIGGPFAGKFMDWEIPCCTRRAAEMFAIVLAAAAIAP